MFLGEAYKVVSEDWQVALQNEIKKPYFVTLDNFLKKEFGNKEVIFPDFKNIFACLQHTSLANTKVVILGQDPYHTPGMANGLCFSVSQNAKLPPSLKNIFKEIHADTQLPINTVGDLKHWAKQGVLLLNTSLTVKSGLANSYSNIGWHLFTDAIIQLVNDNKQNVVFILWGKNAQSKKQFINAQKHLILEAAHPSPLSAHNGFWGCKHFSKTNTYLKNNNLPVIDWHLV